MFCGFAIRSRGECYVLWIRELQIPWFDRSNLFLRRIANPSGRLVGDERHIREAESAYYSLRVN